MREVTRRFHQRFLGEGMVRGSDILDFFTDALTKQPGLPKDDVFAIICAVDQMEQTEVGVDPAFDAALRRAQEAIAAVLEANTGTTRGLAGDARL